MVNALAHVDWERCLIAPNRDPALEDYARRKMGMPFPAVRYFTSVPWLARAIVDLHPEFGLLMHLDLRQVDVLSLVVSQENSCRFCYAAIRMLLWAQGMSETRIQQIEQRLSAAELPAKTVAAIAFGRRQSRGGPPTVHEARQILSDADYNDDEIKEVAFVVGMTDFFNRINTIPAIPVHALERMPDHMLVRLLRPVINRVLQKKRCHGRAVPLEQSLSFPYAGLAKTYDGSPIAPVLARVMEEMWNSSVLTRRCKLLMLAVIARGLDCGMCTADVGAALQQEGLDAYTLNQVLTHLDAPELDEIERVLVRFARETIWYEPAVLQRRARVVRDRLSGPEFIESAGVASLANSLCRMGAMVMRHQP